MLLKVTIPLRTLIVPLRITSFRKIGPIILEIAVEVTVVVAEIVVVVMQTFSAKFAINLVTQQQCIITAMILSIFQGNSSNTFGSEQNQGTNSNKDSQPSAMLVNSENQNPNSTTWIPDFGASFHVIGESHNIQ